jgi:hypothetical protein
MLLKLSMKSLRAFLGDSKYVMLFFVFGDWITTLYALPVGVEGNAVPSLVLEHFGAWGLLVMKLAFVVLLFVFYYYFIEKNPTTWKKVKYICVAMGVFAVVNNLMVIFLGTSPLQLLGIVG